MTLVVPVLALVAIGIFKLISMSGVPPEIEITSIGYATESEGFDQYTTQGGIELVPFYTPDEAMVAMINPGRGLILRLEDEEFTVDNRQLSHIFSRDEAICAHIIPAGRRGWLVGPGWLSWPVRIMPGMQAMLKNFQLSPIDLERFLQQRKDPSKERPKVELPRDSSLKAAVTRMTKEAKAEDHQNLVMTTAQWKKLVFPYMKSSQINEFIKEVVNRVGAVDSVEDINKWIGLAMNIWNNTPQPDRGGKSPFEIGQEYNIQSGG